MPGTTFVHAACFAVGAIIGGGTVAAVGLSRKHQTSRASSVPAVPSGGTAVVTSVQSPTIESGSTRLYDLAKTMENVPGGPVLKYGNPGALLNIVKNAVEAPCA